MNPKLDVILMRKKEREKPIPFKCVSSFDQTDWNLDEFMCIQLRYKQNIIMTNEKPNVSVNKC